MSKSLRIAAFVVAIMMAVTCASMLQSDVDATGNVAAVGSIEYSDIGEAFNSISEETSGHNTVQLLDDCDYTGSISVEGTVTLDLNGHDLTLSGSFIVKGTLNVMDSTSTEPKEIGNWKDPSWNYEYLAGSITSTGSSVISVQDGGKFTLDSGKIFTGPGNYNIAVIALGDTTGNGRISSSAIINGGFISSTEFALSAQGVGASVMVNGGVLTASDNAVVAGNGTKTAEKDLGGVSISMTGGTLVGKITTSGYIACGIYMPNSNSFEVTGGNIYVNNGAGIVARAGYNTVSGVNIETTGTGTGWVGDKKTILSSSAIVLDVDANYPGASEDFCINVSGGNFISENGVASVVEYNTSGNSRLSITGGSFSSDVESFLDSGYKQVGNTVGKIEQTMDSSKPSVDVSSDSGTVVVDVTDNISGATVDATVTPAGSSQVQMSYSGDLTNEGIAMSAMVIAPEDKPDVVEGNPLTVYDLVVDRGNNKSSYTLTVTVTLDIPAGMTLSGAYVMFYEDGKEPERYTPEVDGATVTFTTTHNTYYAVYGDVVEAGSGSQPSWDDDEDLPPFIPTQPAEDDDTVTIVACAAAAAVAAIMAVFLIIDRKG